MRMWEVEFNGTQYALTDDQAEMIQRVYREFLNVQASILDGYHSLILRTLAKDSQLECNLGSA